MSYQKFTIAKLKKQFGLKFYEGRSQVIQPQAIAPSDYLRETIRRNLDLALGVGTEKIRSELIVAPLLVEIREHFEQKISIFSGKEFNVDDDAGLNGYCDFLISGSPELLEITDPVLVIVEAKQDSLNAGIAQCVAAMVAAQQFNEVQGNPIQTIYGASTTGKLWKFIALDKTTVTIDLNEYTLPPLEDVLSFLAAMMQPRSH
ncbi:MAG: hypothetical protein KME21_26190 [Desmonostoc vinosum HA7617-LM4]|jgi:hypothetical protein|nr:hypothetical protein [Desmonostoc vinosum HA7617-LM4]